MALTWLEHTHTESQLTEPASRGRAESESERGQSCVSGQVKGYKSMEHRKRAKVDLQSRRNGRARRGGEHFGAARRYTILPLSPLPASSCRLLPPPLVPFGVASTRSPADRMLDRLTDWSLQRHCTWMMMLLFYTTPLAQRLVAGAKWRSMLHNVFEFARHRPGANCADSSRCMRVTAASCSRRVVLRDAGGKQACRVTSPPTPLFVRRFGG